MSAARATTDHDTIRRWVEERGGHPARVIGTERKGSPGLLRIDYPGFSGEGKLEEITWVEFFEAFDGNDLAFLYQDEGESRFSKIVSRATVEVEVVEEEDDDDEDEDDEADEDEDDEEEDDESDEDDDDEDEADEEKGANGGGR